MELLFEKEVVNIEGQRIKVSFFKRDGRNPYQIKTKPKDIKWEHIRRIDIFDNEQWNMVSEDIIEYITVDKLVN